MKNIDYADLKTDYLEVINFDDDFDLCDALSEEAEIKKVSVITTPDFIDYALNYLAVEDCYHFVKIDFDGNDDKNFYIMLINDYNISILPFTDENNDLLKLSDKIYVDIEAFSIGLISDSFSDNNSVKYFVVGADIEDEDDVCSEESSKSKDKNLHNFTISYNNKNGYESYSYSSSNEITHDKVASLLKQFGFCKD